MKLANFIDETILVTIPKVDPVKWQKVKLRGVEPGGIWIESQEITNEVLQTLQQPSASKTLVFFLPYHAISQIVHFVDEPSLNEKALGV